MFLNFQFSQILTACDRQWWWAAALAGSCIANPVLNVVFIPIAQSHWHNGALGSALAWLVTELLEVVYGVIILREVVLDRFLVRATLAASAAGILQVAVLWAVGNIWLPAGEVAGAAVFVVGAVFLGAVSRDDIALLRDTVARRTARRGRVPALAGQAATPAQPLRTSGLSLVTSADPTTKVASGRAPYPGLDGRAEGSLLRAFQHLSAPAKTPAAAGPSGAPVPAARVDTSDPAQDRPTPVVLRQPPQPAVLRRPPVAAGTSSPRPQPHELTVAAPVTTAIPWSTGRHLAAEDRTPEVVEQSRDRVPPPALTGRHLAAEDRSPEVVERPRDRVPPPALEMMGFSIPRTPDGGLRQEEAVAAIAQMLERSRNAEAQLARIRDSLSEIDGMHSYAHQTVRAAKTIAGHILAGADQQATAIRGRARVEADAIVAEAHSSRDHIVHQATVRRRLELEGLSAPNTNGHDNGTRAGALPKEA